MAESRECTNYVFKNGGMYLTPVTTIYSISLH